MERDCAYPQTYLTQGFTGDASGQRHPRWFLLQKAQLNESIREQIYFVEPDIVRLLLVIAIHLEGDVDFLLIPLGLSGEIDVNVIGLVSNAERHVVNLAADTFECPDEMDPDLRGKMNAGDRNWNPHSVQRIPYVPMMGLIEIAL
jgi:hypothetical protein